MFWHPTATFEPLAASITVGSRTGEGNRAISSRVCPATSGKNASTNAFASAGVLNIFQLAAISALRDIFRNPQSNFSGWNSTVQVTAGTGSKRKIRPPYSPRPTPPPPAPPSDLQAPRPSGTPPDDPGRP